MSHEVDGSNDAGGFALTRSTLVIALLLILAVAVACFIWAAFAKTTWQLIASALASAAVSIAVALLITEIVLKPVFTRDLLRVAGLRHRLVQIGIADVTDHQTVPWKKLYTNSARIQVVVTRPRFWLMSHLGHLEETARTRQLMLDVYLPSVSAGAARIVASNLGETAATYEAEVAAVANDLARAWSDMERKPGSSLTIYWLNQPPLLTLTKLDDTTVVTLPPYIPDRTSQHLAIRFKGDLSSDVAAWLNLRWKDLDAAADRVPAWTDRREPRALKSRLLDSSGSSESEKDLS